MFYSRKSSVSTLEYLILIPVFTLLAFLIVLGIYLFVSVAGGLLLMAHQAVFAWDQPTVLEVIGKTIGMVFLFHLDNVLLYDVYFTIKWVYNYCII